MNELDLEQGSAEWIAARVGSLGASRVADAVARTKAGFGASRANLMAELIAERLTGEPAACFVNDAMRWGTEKEPDARAAYEFHTDVDVAAVGLVRHPAIDFTHASPDGLVGDAGLVEIKCPSTATQIDTLLGQKVPARYVTQMQWQMACTGRRWCDFVSFDPRMPEAMRLYVKRIVRDDAVIADLEREVSTFLAELAGKVAELRLLFSGEQRSAAA